MKWCTFGSLSISFSWTGSGNKRWNLCQWHNIQRTRRQLPRTAAINFNFNLTEACIPAPFIRIKHNSTEVRRCADAYICSHHFDDPGEMTLTIIVGTEDIAYRSDGKAFIIACNYTKLCSMVFLTFFRQSKMQYCKFINWHINYVLKLTR